MASKVKYKVMKTEQIDIRKRRNKNENDVYFNAIAKAGKTAHK